MSCSPAQLDANRRNAQRSKGPTTPEGKAISRRNALKHGLTGSGVALPTEDQAAISDRFIGLQNQMAPKTDAGELLLRRFAFLSVRIERCEKHETSETSKRVRHAIARFDDERLAAVEALGTRLYAEPATTVRRLQMTPEGIDWLLNEWEILRADLLNPDRNCWTQNHRMHFDALLGLNPGGYRVARIMALSDARDGSFRHLDKLDGEGLEGPARAGWAQGELTRLIDVEMARLEEARAKFDHRALAADRAEAVDRALFDPSKEAILARKYEAATERAMYRALKEYRQVEAEGAELAESGLSSCKDEDCEQLGSNFRETEDDVSEPGPEVPATARMVDFEPSAPTVLNISIGRGPEIGPMPPDHISRC